MDGGAEEFELVGLLEFGTDIVVALVVVVRLVDCLDDRLKIHVNYLYKSLNLVYEHIGEMG